MRCCCRKSGDLEEEINTLKRQLSIYESNPRAGRPASVTELGVPFNLDLDTAQNEESPHDMSRKSVDALDRILTTTIPGGMSPASPDQSSLPGATTIPNGTIPDSLPTRVAWASSSRKLRDIELSKDEINELFRM